MSDTARLPDSSLLDDLNRRKLHADLQCITLELQRFAADLRRAIGTPVQTMNEDTAAVMDRLHAALRSVAELDVALAMLAEPECKGC